MNIKKPSARGLYVIINGDLYCVTGSRQFERATRELPVGQFVSITRWDGAEWSETGLVLYGARVPS